MNTAIIIVASYFIYLSALITAIYWLTLSRKTKLAFIWSTVLAAILALVIAKVAAALYNDPRPFISSHITPLIHHAADNGFPSDHALLAAFLGFSVFLYSRKIGGLLLVIAAAIGAARVVAGVHHPIDIIGSFIIAAAAVSAVDFASNLYKRYNT